MKVLASIPITYTTLDGDRVHSPMIVARVGGIETRLVLDTGSEIHLITRDLADSIGLIGVPGEDGIDHAGATMPSLDVGTVGLDVEGFALELAYVVAIQAPPPFPGWGVGGILSPQRLHPTASIVIDLRADEMVLVDDEADGLRDWLADRAPELDLVPPRVDAGAERAGRYGRTPGHDPDRRTRPVSTGRLADIHSR